MNYSRPIAAIAILIFCTCKSADEMYKSEATKGVDFKKYKTYAWLPTQDTSYTKLVSRKQFVTALVPAVIKELSERGMVLDTANPDCLFRYTLVVTNKFDVEQGPREVSYSPQVYQNPYYGGGYVYYFSSDNQPAVYGGKMNVTKMREGTLVIDMIDKKEHKIVWRSSATGKREEEQPAILQKTLNTIIQEMFKKFPKK